MTVLLPRGHQDSKMHEVFCQFIKYDSAVWVKLFVSDDSDPVFPYGAGKSVACKKIWVTGVFS